MNPPIDISEEAGVRYLHFGSDWIQGAMRIRKPYALELAYTREMMAGLLLRDGLAADGAHWPRKVLIIGLGCETNQIESLLETQGLQASAQLILAGLVGASSGLLAKWFGYQSLFIGAGVLGVMVLGVVIYYFVLAQPRPEEPAAG